MMPVRHPFSAFEPENTPLLHENQYNYIRFDFLNPPFHYPLRARFQPVGLQAGGEAIAHYSNCERSELSSFQIERLSE
jgi:hypothetical protein